VSLPDVVAAVMFVGITLYALLAGADFGAGFWDLVAGNSRRGGAPRALIERSIAPVWEANHVWLIFVLVVLWTGFPRAFAPIMATLYLPLTFAAIGIILRGGAFAFRKASTTLPAQRLFGATFAFSSVLTPFFLGAVVGAVASGRVPAGDNAGNVITSWWNPTSVLGGVLAVVVCAFLASVYLAGDARREEEVELTAHFRERALATGVLAGITSAVGVVVLREDARHLFDGLVGRGAPLIVVAALAGATTLVLVWKEAFETARYVAALAVVAVLWGWAAAQYPWLLIDTLTIDEGAGARSTLQAMLGTLGVGVVLLVPALMWLLVLTQRGMLSAEHEEGVDRDGALLRGGDPAVDGEDRAGDVRPRP
jgi:cytochrome d ubiquinol oxidase subunit II